MILGVDTSCYTTSLAVVGDGYLVESKRALDVKMGQRGLRQSDAFFQHVQRLPDLLMDMESKLQLLSADEKIADLKIGDLKAVCVSTRPRNIETSYMPVFTAGHKFAQSVATALNIPLYETSHQDGHIMAACMGEHIDYTKRYLAVHLSGGTTEILTSKWDDKEGKFVVDILGGTLDISAGQLIDRVGVAHGMAFPAGRQMDELADDVFDNRLLNPTNRLKFPVSMKTVDDIKNIPNTYFNLSGAESYAMKYLGQNKDIHDIADGLFDVIAESLYHSLFNIASSLQIYDVLMSGGVSSSTTLKKKLLALSQHNKNHKSSLNSNCTDNNCHGKMDGRLTFHFATPRYCADNAIGVAKIGYVRLRNEDEAKSD